MINVNVPPLPISGKHFMSDNEHTVMIEASLSGVKLAGLIGSLQCGTREQAKTMNCQLSVGNCQCANGEKSVALSCHDHDLEKLMSMSNILLPKASSGLIIVAQDGKFLQIKFSKRCRTSKKDKRFETSNSI